MPNYTLNRNYTLRSTSGVIQFVKGEPTFVPRHMEREVVAIGGELADLDVVAPTLVPQDAALPDVPRGEDRSEQIQIAMALIVERNESSDFTASGSPTVKAVEKITGFDVDRNEVASAWTKFKQAGE